MDNAKVGPMVGFETGWPLGCDEGLPEGLDGLTVGCDDGNLFG